MNESPPVIVKLHPSVEEYEEAENNFLRAVGNCVNAWAFVDRRMFQLFKLALKSSALAAATIYYKDKSISGRHNITSSMLKLYLSKEEFDQEWMPIGKKIDDLIPTRNVIVHCPVRRIGTSDGKKAIYIYEIYPEPNEMMLEPTRKPKGMRGQHGLGESDLKQHAEAVVEVEAQLTQLLSKLVGDVRQRIHDRRK